MIPADVGRVWCPRRGGGVLAIDGNRGLLLLEATDSSVTTHKHEAFEVACVE
jgi:hypothetical protein